MFVFLSVYEASFIKLFHFSNLLQSLTTVYVEFFSNFSCSSKRISFSDPLSRSLSTSDGRPLYSLSSKLLSPLQNFLNHHSSMHCLAVSGPKVFSICELFLVLYNQFWTWIRKSQTEIKISWRNINNLRYTDDTTLMAESEGELKSLLMKVKEESGRSWLKAQHSEN